MLHAGLIGSEDSGYGWSLWLAERLGSLMDLTVLNLVGFSRTLLIGIDES